MGKETDLLSQLWGVGLGRKVKLLFSIWNIRLSMPRISKDTGEECQLHNYTTIQADLVDADKVKSKSNIPGKRWDVLFPSSKKTLVVLLLQPMAVKVSESSRELPIKRVVRF